MPDTLKEKSIAFSSMFYQRFHAGLTHVPSHELPVLTKKKLMEHWNDVVTDRSLTLEELQTFMEGYEISDRVALADLPTPCECGKPFAVLAGIQGRVEDTMFLQGDGGDPVAITPDIFHDVLEPAPMDGWQVVQENATSIVVLIVRPQRGYDERTLTEQVKLRLREQGAHEPGVQVRIIEKLQRSLTGKTPLVQALPHHTEQH